MPGAFGSTKVRVILVATIVVAGIVALVLGLRGCGCDGSDSSSTTTVSSTDTTEVVVSITEASTTTLPQTTTTTKVVRRSPATTSTSTTSTSTTSTSTTSTSTTSTSTTSTTLSPSPYAGTHSGTYLFSGDVEGNIVFVIAADGSVTGSGGDFVLGAFVVHGTVSAAGALSASGPVEYDGGPQVISFFGTFADGGLTGSGGFTVTDSADGRTGIWGVPNY